MAIEAFDKPDKTPSQLKPEDLAVSYVKKTHNNTGNRGREYQVYSELNNIMLPGYQQLAFSEMLDKSRRSIKPAYSNLPVAIYIGFEELYLPNYGTDLADLFNHDFNRVLILSTIIQSVEAVRQFHNLGFIHRDIKLENFVYDGKTVRLIDFEFAVK